MGTEDLNSYLEAIARLTRVATDREQALTEAERTGRATLDDVLASERRNRDSADLAQRRLAEVQKNFERLQFRTGPIEPQPPQGVPTTLSAMPGWLASLGREIESVGQAQQWVERATAQLTDVRRSTVSVAAPAQTQPATVLPPLQPEVPQKEPPRAARVGILVTLLVAVLVVIFIFFAH